MGCDGGTIPRRDELVRTKKKEQRIERDVENAAKWKHCALTQQPLQQPLVACYLGKLYNKEAVIEAILNKTIGTNESTSHIRGMKDLKSLNLTSNPAYDISKVDQGDEFKDHNISPFICPVVGVEMNGKYRFCVIWSCGCVVSEKSLKECKTDTCNKCGKAFQNDDIIILYGTEEEIATYRSRDELRRDLQKAAKAKKAQNGSVANDDTPSTSGTSTATAAKTKEKRKADTTNKNTSNTSSQSNAKKFKSIQDDPKASSVLKSIFTTCEAAKNQPKAHWVTHNPLYY